MLHARSDHQAPLLAPLSESPRWQLISDEFIDRIQAAEKSAKEERSPYYHRRCLLCQPRFGDAMSHMEFERHFLDW